ncbi:MAG: cell division protein FtsA [Bacteroidia bacterium]|nr:cell division protein FtsA [Bacteroidia bacterium]
MNQSNIIVGLDIGTTKICAIVGSRDQYGRVKILGKGHSESLGVLRGVVTNIERTVEAIKQAVAEADSKSDVIIKDVHVGIAGQHIKSLQNRGMRTRHNIDDEISQQDIDAIVDDMYKLAMKPGEEIIHVIPQEYIVDKEPNIKDPIGMSGIQLEVNCHIITGLVTAANNIQKCVRKANLNPLDLILEPLASAEAVLTDEEKEAGVVLVDIGGGTTDIAIFQDGIIRHTAVIPFGGNVITEDIKNGCSIIKGQAELLKVKFGSALASQTSDHEIVSIPGLKGREPKEISVRNLASIIQARMEEIIENVYFEIKNSGYSKKLIAGAVITGGGAQLKHIQQLFELITGMDARIGYPNEHLSAGNDEIKSPMFATAVGLVIMGLNDAEKNQNKTQIKPDEQTTVPMQPTKKRGNFFNAIKELFSDDETDREL